MKKLFLSLVMIIAVSNVCYGASLGSYDAGSINSDYIKDMRLHETAMRNKNNSAIISTKTTPKTQDEVTASDIKSITFVNNQSISSSELLKAAEDKINQPMTVENISAIRRGIMKYYQDRGYFSAVVMVVSQDTQTGELVLEVKEGGKNSISIQD